MSDVVVTILAVLHVISAMSWLGGAALFVSIVAPGLRSVSPQASLEFLAKIGPKALRFFIGVATLTIVFGLGLFFASGVSNPAIYIGLLLGLVAYLDALVFTVPALRKADKIAGQMLESHQAGPPPAEFTAALRRGGIGSTSVLVIIVLAAIFMVISGFMY